ncbi:MAG: IS3 family transposase [Chloroflexi bacterium]|nr:IS3 family transposase [Chloroflexota bacterium]
MSLAKRRRAVAHVCETLTVSERRACRVVGQARATERYVPRESADEQALLARIVALATRFGRYGYRRITALLRQAGWRVNHKRVERLWRQEGLKVPQKQPKRGRLWLADGSIIRRRAERPNHVWSYDFVLDRTADGRPLRMLTIIDEFTRDCLAIDVARRLNSRDVLARLADLCVERAVPEHIRSDNGPEFAAKAVRRWLARVGVQTLFIEPGGPWENGYSESFNGKLRDECLNLKRFDTLLEAQVLIERWRLEYNHRRPHSSLGYRPPAPEAIEPNRLEIAARLTQQVV